MRAISSASALPQGVSTAALFESSAQLAEALAARDLPASMAGAVQQHYRPLARWLAERSAADGAPLIGLNGAQGTGKSTLARLLCWLLEEIHGLRVAVLSLDDFYLGHAARAELARTVHPLLQTRGVPGTHDLPSLQACIGSLRAADAHSRTRLPAFVKVQDDLAPVSDWPQFRGRPDLILLEGWCVGTPPQSGEALRAPCNELERQADPDGRWREWVNQQLAGPYAALFGEISALIQLAAPDFETVFAWRKRQEVGNAASGGAAGMNDAQLRHFIAHYERLTRHGLRVLPATADVRIQLNHEHGVAAVSYAR